MRWLIIAITVLWLGAGTDQASTTSQPPRFPPLRFALRRHLFVSPARGKTLTTLGPLPINERVTDIDIDPRTNRIYVLHGEPKAILTVMDGWDHHVIRDIPVGASSTLLQVNAATGRAYVWNGKEKVIRAYDGASGRDLGSFGVRAAGWLCIAPEINRIYAPDPEGVAVLDGTTHVQIALIKSDGQVGLACNPNSKRVYISQPRTHSLLVVDGPANKVLKTIRWTRPSREGAYGPGDIAVDARSNRVYVAGAGIENTVTILDGRTDHILKTIPARQYPSRLAVDPGTGRVYIGHGMDFGLLTLDGRRGAVAESTECPDAVSRLLVNPVTRRVYAYLESGLVLVFAENPRR